MISESEKIQLLVDCWQIKRRMAMNEQRNAEIELHRISKRYGVTIDLSGGQGSQVHAPASQPSLATKAEEGDQAAGASAKTLRSSSEGTPGSFWLLHHKEE